MIAAAKYARENNIPYLGLCLGTVSYTHLVLDKTSKAYQVYGTENISERHRHRYEVNNDYRTALTEPVSYTHLDVYKRQVLEKQTYLCTGA